MKRLTLAILLLVAPSYSQAARFVPLGILPTAVDMASFSVAVSADGNVVIGSSYDEMFRWTEATGMTSLGTDFNGNKPAAYSGYMALSGDGKVIAGVFGPSGQPFRWTATGGFVLLPPRLNPPKHLSYDGAIIVNYGEAMSWDGSVVVGDTFSEGYLDRNGVRTWLGDLPGGYFRSAARGVSADGSVAVGVSETTTNYGGQQVVTDLPFYWTESGGIVPLEGWFNGVATDISASKLAIVGFGAKTKSPGEPFRWTPSRGMQSVKDLLMEEGINITALGWTLDSKRQEELYGLDPLYAVSANGRIIVGSGTNPSGSSEAWLIELPPVPGDFDNDGDSDGNDFLNWQRGFGDSYDASDLDDWQVNLAFLESLASPSAPASLGVPEPASGIVSLLLVALALKSRNCRRN